MEVELLTNINKSWLNMSTLMMNANISQDSLNSNNDNSSPQTIVAINSTTKQTTTSSDPLATVENGDELMATSQQINLSEMIISKNANLKIDIDTFLGESLFNYMMISII